MGNANKKKRKLRIIIAASIALVIIGTVLIMSLIQASSNSLSTNVTAQTINLERTDISQTVSVSGVVESANVTNIYSTQTFPIMEIYVAVGDSVRVGDLLAELDMSRLYNDIAQAEINLRSAIASAEEEIRTNENTVVNARTSLESSQIALTRQQHNTSNAQQDLRDAETGISEDFDSFTFDNAIEDASVTLDRRNADRRRAEQDYEDAKADEATKKSDLEKAEQDYNDAVIGGNNNAIDAAAIVLNDAQIAYDTAVRKYETAVQARTNARNAVADAERLYDRAVAERDRAIESNADNRGSSLESAQRAYQDSLTQLDSSRNSVRSAQNSLDQAESRPESQGTSVELQELNLERLYSQLEEGKIFASAAGVITDIGAIVGANPGGVLFVIEDTENLYVSARIREHNVSSVFIGQDAQITTEATGNNTFDAVLSFISPRAVSAAGSTSVEFEVQASLINPDTMIKIGMNAFLDIIIEEKPNVFVVPSSLIVTNERGNFVYTTENGERQEIAVSTGIRTMASTEISGNGLFIGMELLVDPEGLLSSGNDFGFPPMFGG